jgi:hypothetical protein
MTLSEASKTMRFDAGWQLAIAGTRIFLLACMAGLGYRSHAQDLSWPDPVANHVDSEGTTVKIKWLGGYPDNVHYLRQRNTVYAVVSVNNLIKAGRTREAGYQFIAYDAPQVVVSFHGGYTGEQLYAEGLSTLDAPSPQPPAVKKNRFGHLNQ